MKYVLHIWGTLIWLPFTLLFYLFYIGPCLIMKQLYWDGWADFLIPKFVVKEETAAAWFLSLWGGWWGHALPTFIVTRHDTDDPRFKRTLVHECRHVWQLFVFWIFQPIIYVLHTLYLYLFTNRHAYYDNCFERDARRAAGQQVDIPPEQWRDPKDRWPWW